MALTLNPLYVGQKSTAANLDIWLLALQEKVTKLEEELKSKDKVIIEMSKKVDDLQNKAPAIKNNSSSEFWSKFSKEASIGIASIMAKEKMDIGKKEKNLIVFGLPESTATEPSDKFSEDSESITNLLKEIKVNIDIKSLKIIRFNKQSNGEATSVNPRSTEN